MQQYVKARALECEECIFTASGQADAPEEPETTETGTHFHTCHRCFDVLPGVPVGQTVVQGVWQSTVQMDLLFAMSKEMV